jgi:hypothetical protein
MCHMSVELKESMLVQQVVDVVDRSSFHLRSIRVVPVARGSRVTLLLSLGGGPRNEFDELILGVSQLPGVVSMHNTIPVA